MTLNLPTSRNLLRVVYVGIVCFALTQLALHYLQPELNPLDQAVSYYVHGHQGWLLTFGLFGLGIASVALTVALARLPAAEVNRVGLRCLAIWSVGVLVGATFAADPPGGWSKPPSVGGSIHGIAAMIAFLSFPIAALQLSRGFRSGSHWAGHAQALRRLAITTAAGLLLFFVSLVPVFVRPGPPILLGFTERLLLVAYLVWLWTCATAVFRLSERQVHVP